jgi:hypothetical protein
VGAGRPEPQGGGPRAAARPRHQRVLPPWQGLAGDCQPLGRRRAAHAAGHDHGGQSHRDGGARAPRVRPRQYPDRRAGRGRPDSPHRPAGARAGGVARGRGTVHRRRGKRPGR